MKKNIIAIVFIVFACLVLSSQAFSQVSSQVSSSGAADSLEKEGKVFFEENEIKDLSDLLSKDKGTLELVARSKTSIDYQINKNGEISFSETQKDANNPKTNAWEIRFNGEGKEQRYGVKEGYSSKIVLNDKGELSDGTSYISDGKEHIPANIKEEIRDSSIRFNGYVYSAPKNAKIEVKDSKAEIELGKDSTGIKTPVKVSSSTGTLDNSEKTLEYNINKGSVLWIDKNNNPIKAEGKLSFSGEQAFFDSKKDKSSYLKLDDIGLYPGSNEKDQKVLIFTVNKNIPENNKEQYMLIGSNKKNLIINNPGKDKGIIFDFGKDNPFVKFKGDGTDILKKQLSISVDNGKIELSNEKNDLSLIKGYGDYRINQGKGGIESRDGEIKYYINKNPIDTGDHNDFLSVGSRLIPMDKEGNPLLIGVDGNSILFSDNNQLVTESFNEISEDKNPENKISELPTPSKENTGGGEVSLGVVPPEYKEKLKLLPIDKQNEFKYIPPNERIKYIDEEYNKLFSAAPVREPLPEEKPEKIGGGDISIIEQPSSDQDTPLKNGFNWNLEQGDNPLEGKTSIEQSIMISSARISVDQGRFIGYGSGTIIGTDKEYAYILSCEHLFGTEIIEQTNGKKTEIEFASGEIKVDIFDPRLNKNRAINGELVAKTTPEKDVSLIRIPLNEVGGKVAFSRIAPKDYPAREGEKIITAGCSLSRDCTLKYGFVQDVSNLLNKKQIEAIVYNINGRSGGGMFNLKGELIGVDSSGPGISFDLPEDYYSLPENIKKNIYNTAAYRSYKEINEFLNEIGYSWLMKIFLIF